MATVREVITKSEQKKDGTWNVKIRITHKNQSAYLKTPHFVTQRQLKKDFTLKDNFIVDLINPVLAEYRNQISALAPMLPRLSARQIADHLGKGEGEGDHIDFGKFCQEYIASLKNKGKTSSANNLQTVLNSLNDFFDGRQILATDITAQMLIKYEDYLTSRRVMYRENQFGKIVKIVRKGVTSGLHNYMRDLRLLFNAARDKYNDEDSAVYEIPHYPFKKYKVKQPPAPEKRNLSPDQIIAIRDLQLEAGTRMELARDLFMLSFYLCGMNARDLWDLKKINKGRVEYNRSKTAGRRRDKAFISINIPDVAKSLLAKYISTLADRYAEPDNLSSALNKGLKLIGNTVGIEKLTFYHARHSFGNLARNKCRFSKDDVALAMNHIDQGRKTTDVYIAPDWGIVDEVQASVISLLDFGKDSR